MKTKIFADFKICISVPLIKLVKASSYSKCTVFRDFGKNMVGKRYFQHQTVLVITGKNNEKSGFKITKNDFDVWTVYLKKYFFKHLPDFCNTLKTFKISKFYIVICKC